MELIDTHTHLYSSKFDNDRDEMIQRAIDVGVTGFFLPNIDQGSIAGMLAMEAAYPEQCFAMMGLHPCSVKEDYQEELAIVKTWLEKRPFAAVGEIGLDLYWDKSFLEQQKDAFLTQINWAMDLDLPIVIHSRESTEMIIDILKSVNDRRLRGIFHCFGGNIQQARAITELGFSLGIGGVLTFRRSGLDETIKEVDMQWIVLETDAPYLAPTPHRGKRNESAYLRLVAEKLAEIKGMEVEEVAQITTENAKEIFKKVPINSGTL